MVLRRGRAHPNRKHGDLVGYGKSVDSPSRIRANLRSVALGEELRVATWFGQYVVVGPRTAPAWR
jgi:hypothetical protein